jgi:hypothetical protein
MRVGRDGYSYYLMTLIETDGVTAPALKLQLGQNAGRYE